MKDYILGLYEKSMPPELSWKQKFLSAKEAGFDFIEISIDETDEKLSRLDWSFEQRFELVKEMYETKIFIRTMCLSAHRKYSLGSSNEKIRERSLEIMEKAIQLAYDLGIRIIQLAGYDVYYEESNDKTVENFKINLKKCVEMASIKGVVLAFETMETEFMNTIDKAMKYVEFCNSPYLQIYPDCGNVKNAMNLYQKSIVDDFKAGKGHLIAVHLKETLPGKFREIPYGKGHVNFLEVIEISLYFGIKIYVAEFWYTGSLEWKKDLNNAKNFFMNQFNQLSI